MQECVLIRGGRTNPEIANPNINTSLLDVFAVWRFTDGKSYQIMFKGLMLLIRNVGNVSILKSNTGISQDRVKMAKWPHDGVQIKVR